MPSQTDVSGAIIPMPGGGTTTPSLGSVGMPLYLLDPKAAFMGGGYLPSTGYSPPGVNANMTLGAMTETPQWALDAYGTPERVYEHFQGFDDPAAQWAYEAQQLGVVDPGAAEAHEAGVAALDPIDAAITDLLADVQGDPTYDYITDELTRRSSPDFSLFGPAQRGAMERNLALGLNRAQSAQQAEISRSGWGRSGSAQRLDPMFSAIGSAGLAGISADLATRNEAARGGALSDLGAFNLDWDRLLTGITGLQTQAGQYRAGFEAGEPLSGFDPWLGYAVSEASRLEEEESRRLDEALDFAEAESQPNIWDLGSGFLSLIDTGVFPG